jgi:quercetin dioxygenase-like cupin family protein
MMSKTEAGTKTQGATRAGGDGRLVFAMAELDELRIGVDYSSTRGFVVEGDRMMVGLMRIPAGTGAERHSHPNEQWIYVLEGVFHAVVGDEVVRVPAGSVLYIPSGIVHEGRAGSERDLVFFTVKDTSHSLHGIKAS